MLNDIQAVFRRSWNTFRTELNRREPEDQVAELLSAMRKEMVEARAALSAQEDAIGDARNALAAEQNQLADCERRRTMAERIGDAETVRVAAEFSNRHRERVAVLEQKLEAVQAETQLRTREVEQMTRRYREADDNRFVLLSQIRLRRTQQQVHGATGDDAGSFSEFERMADRVDERAAYADALEELQDVGGTASAEPPASSRAERERTAEERLRELKRRMGQE